jgi:hypothetical protein
MSPTVNQNAPTFRNPFSETLTLIQSHLQENLPSGTRRVWVDGNMKGFANLCITVFPTVGEYHFIFHRINNFRNISPSMTDEEISEIVSGYVIEIRNLIDQWVGLDD